MAREKSGVPEFDHDLFNKLKSLNNQRVRVTLKTRDGSFGTSLTGQLNYVGDSSTITGKPWTSIDIGVNRTQDIDNIISVEAV